MIFATLLAIEIRASNISDLERISLVIINVMTISPTTPPFNTPANKKKHEFD